jgi:hypothetical protein
MCLCGETSRLSAVWLGSVANHESNRVFDEVWKYLCRDRLCIEPIRSLRARGIDPRTLVEPLCWFLFLAGQPKWSMERLASQGQTGHDWRSLQRLPRRLAAFLNESTRLESAARRPLPSLSSGRNKLHRASKGIHPSAVLAPDLLTQPFPNSLEDRRRLLEQAVPNAREYMRRDRQEQDRKIRLALGRLVQSGLTYQQIAFLLDGTARALGTTNPFSAAALKMRFRRSTRSQ